MGDIRESSSDVNVDTYSLVAGPFLNLTNLAAQINANCRAIQTAERGRPGRLL